MAHLWAAVSVLILALHQTLAQSFLDIPQCADKAAFSSITTIGCQLKDIKCICKDQSLVDSLLPKVKDACSQEDFQKTIDVTKGLCDTNGVTITVPTSAPTVPTSIPRVHDSFPGVPASKPTVPTSTPTVPLSTPTVPASSPTTNSTGKPRVIPTFTIFSKDATRTGSLAPFQNSTSNKSPAATNTAAHSTPKPSTFTGAANRNSAAYIWAATILGTTVLLLI